MDNVLDLVRKINMEVLPKINDRDRLELFFELRRGYCPKCGESIKNQECKCRKID